MNFFQFIGRSKRLLDHHFNIAPPLCRRQRRVQLPRSALLQVREEASLQLCYSDRQPGGRRLHGFRHSHAVADRHHSGRLLAIRAGYVRHMVRGRLQCHAGLGLRLGRHLHWSSLGNQMVPPLPQVQHQEESGLHVPICLVRSLLNVHGHINFITCTWCEVNERKEVMAPSTSLVTAQDWFV